MRVYSIKGGNCSSERNRAERDLENKHQEGNWVKTELSFNVVIQLD